MFIINFKFFCYNNSGSGSGLKVPDSAKCLDPDPDSCCTAQTGLSGCFNQGFGSEIGLAPDSIGSVDLDADSRQDKLIPKVRENQENSS
jgi:hypothetical protein